MITDQPKPQSNARTARQLLRAHRYGALSTLSKKFDGHPFGSITPYLVDHDGSLLILISSLAEHTKNILHDSRVSLITHDQHNPHIQTQGRVTLVGRATLDSNRDACGKRYLRYFPEAQTYFDMLDFNFFRIVPEAIRYIGGFGDIHWVKSEQYQVEPYALMSEEDSLLDELNRNHSNASLICGEIIGIDCDGFDVRMEGAVLRQTFDEMTLNSLQARRTILASSATNHAPL